MMAFKTERMRSSMKVLLLVSSDQAPYSDANPFGGIHTTLTEDDGEPCWIIWPRFGWIMQNLPRSHCSNYSDYIEHVVILGRLSLSLLVVLVLAKKKELESRRFPLIFCCLAHKSIKSYHQRHRQKSIARLLFQGPRLCRVLCACTWKFSLFGGKPTILQCFCCHLQPFWTLTFQISHWFILTLAHIYISYNNL